MFRVWVNSHRWSERTNPKVFNVISRWRYAKPVDPASVDALVRSLGIKQSNAVQILRGFKIPNVYAHKQIAKSHALCLEHGIDDDAITAYPDLLKVKPITLEQRIYFYKDLGCPRIIPSMILTFTSGMRVTPNELKAQNLLPADADVIKNLLSCLHEQPTDIPEVERPSDDERLDVIHTQLLRHYLTWKLELTEEQLNKIMNSKLRLKNQSFSLLREMLDILLNEFGFTKQKVRNNSFMLSKSPSNTRQIMKEVPKIGDADIKDIMFRFPRILHVQVDALHHKLDTIKEHGVRDEAISRVPCILSLAAKTVAKRIQEFKTIKELAGHWKHPRILMMIFYFEGVKRHMKVLKELDIKFTSMHILCTGTKAFQRFTQLGSERTKAKDTLRFLADELEMDKESIQLALKRHPLWCHISFIFVQETFIYLVEQNFSNKDIFHNIHIVLYKRAQVERYLKNIDDTRVGDSWELTDSRKLALCLYNIEIEYHFSGNGIWDCQNNGSSLTKNQEKQVLRLRLTSKM